MKCDLTIIGAGPGGTMAAKTAAEAGLDVVLLEKRQEIGEPVRCAEGVSIRSELKELIDVDPGWISREIKGMRLYSPDGCCAFTEGNSGDRECGCILERKIFDRGLAKVAARCGARIMVKTRATGLVRENGLFSVSAISQGEPMKIESHLVIGADGVESKVARWTGMDRGLNPEDIMVCSQYLVLDDCIDQDFCQFFFGKKIAPGGYVWIFPKGYGLANVGIGLQGSLSGPGMPVRLLDDFLEKRMPGAKVLQIVAGGIPTSGPMKIIASDGMMLVGDAARQSDPLTGGGIINAMRAGAIAGEVAAKAQSLKDFSKSCLREYEDRWRSSYSGKHLEKCYHAKKLFLKLEDDDLNCLIGSLAGHNISCMRTQDLLRLLVRMNPRMLWKLKDLVF